MSRKVLLDSRTTVVALQQMAHNAEYAVVYTIVGERDLPPSVF